MSWLTKCLELSPGLIVSLILYKFWPPADNTEALLNVLIGLTLSTITSTIGDSSRAKKQTATSQQLTQALLRTVSLDGASSPILRLFLRSGVAYLSVDRFPSVYIELMWNIQTSYDTTIVINEQDTSAGYNQQALEIQRAKIFSSGVRIRRIFVCRDEKDITRLMPFMKIHAQANIDVRYITKQKIKGTTVLKNWVSSTPSLDFSIIDDKYTLTTVLNNRSLKIEKFRLSSEDSELKRYKEFYAALASQSVKVSA